MFSLKVKPTLKRIVCWIGWLVDYKTLTKTIVLTEKPITKNGPPRVHLCLGSMVSNCHLQRFHVSTFKRNAKQRFGVKNTKNTWILTISPFQSPPKKTSHRKHWNLKEHHWKLQRSSSLEEAPLFFLPSRWRFRDATQNPDTFSVPKRNRAHLKLFFCDGKCCGEKGVIYPTQLAIVGMRVAPLRIRNTVTMTTPQASFLDNPFRGGGLASQ